MRDVTFKKLLDNMYYKQSKIDILFEGIKDNLITEDYNLYDKIEKDVRFLFDKVVETLEKSKNNDITCKYQYNNGILKGIKTITVNITYSNNLDKIASIYVYENILTVDINYGLLLKLADVDETYKIIYEALENTLYHELTHGKIESEIQVKNETNNNYEWYDIASDYLIYNSKYDVNLYRFFYSLYCSYYQEIQANAAESTYEISTFIKEDENWGQYSNNMKISMLDVYLKRTEGYKKYSVIKNVFLPFIKTFDECIKEKIFMIFKNENYNITEKEYNNFVKQIEFACNRALSKMQRGLVKYYNEYNLN